ncbi:hypothetical protein MVEN_01146700 [Mycena venus]|uniref:Uncharacterized protein n=1 Tax=Mycena venus TaxID=2733690 RepID=A0A8H6Y3P8_9AGAR|nr:hypothetical protein MVEN_01146700 [Mycena venus]
MTVSVPPAARPFAPTPLVTRHIVPSDISHPNDTSRIDQTNGSSPSLSTPLLSLSTPHSLSTHLLVARPVASSLLSHTHGISRPEQADDSFNSPSMPIPSHSTVHTTSVCPSPPRRKRSRRCFVCGGTGKHRLSPRYCPRTYELLSKHLAKFDTNFRLVSDDGSPLPMTRHPGGVAAHLLSPRRPRPRTVRASSRSVSESPLGSHSNPPHVPRAPHATPPIVSLRVPNTVPTSDLNPPHAPSPSVVERRHIPSAEPSVDSNPPHMSPPSVVHSGPISRSDHSVAPSILHFPPVERLPSPPIYIPVRIPLPDSKPPADSSSEDSPPHIPLSIFELLFISPPIRDELRKLIDVLDRKNVGYEIPTSPSLRKVFFRIFDRIVTSLSPIRII